MLAPVVVVAGEIGLDAALGSEFGNRLWEQGFARLHLMLFYEAIEERLKMFRRD